MKTVPVEARIADMPPINAFFTAVAHLLHALAECDVLLPPPVMTAAEEVRQAVAGLGGKDAGTPP